MPRLHCAHFSLPTGSNRTCSTQQLINASDKRRRCEEVALNVRRHPFHMISQQISADEDNGIRTRLCSMLASDRETDFLRLLEMHQPRLLDAACADGCTLLQRAAIGGHGQATAALLATGANPNATGCFKKFSAPLITAARLNHLNVLENLLVGGKNKIEINAKDTSGNTALHYAALGKQVDSVAKLLQAGADPDIRNHAGRVALSTKQVRWLCHSCVATNDESEEGDNFQVMLNFKMFLPAKENVCYSDQNQRCFSVEKGSNYYSKGNKSVNTNVHYDAGHTKLYSEMEVLRKFNNKNMKECLDHPLIRAYLELKWRPLKYILYLDFLLHVLYFIFVNLFCVRSSELLVNCINNSNINYSLYADLDEVDMCQKIELDYLGSATLILGIVSLLRELRRFYCVRNMYSRYEFCFLLSLLVNVVSFILIYTQVYVCFLATIITSVLVLAYLFQRSPFHSNITRATDAVSKRFVLFLFSQIMVIVSYVLILYVLNLNVSAKSIDTDPEGLGYFDTFGGSFINILLIMTGSLEIKTSNMVVKSLIVYIMFSGILIFSLMTAIAVNDLKSIKKEVSIKCIQNRIFLITECESLLMSIHKVLLCVPCVPKCFLGFSRRVNVFDNDSGEYYVKPNVIFTDNENVINAEVSLPEKIVILLLNIINNKQNKENGHELLKEFVHKQNRILERFVENMETKFAKQMDFMSVQMRDTVLTTLQEPIQELDERIN